MEGRRLQDTRFKVGTWTLVFYLVVITLLLSFVLINHKGYNDRWILDGIFAPILVFIFVFFVIQSFVKSNQKIAILTASFLVVLNLVPGFKYQLFYNTYDTSFHFGFTNNLSLLGFVPETPDGSGPSKYYSTDPGMHIFLSSLSIVSGIPTNEIFRFVLPTMQCLVPLIAFFITNGLLSKNVQRHIIIASALPVTQGFIITGTKMNVVPYFLFLAVFLRYIFTNKNNREYLIIFIILGLTLVVSHPVTPILAALLLIGMPLALRTLRVFSPKGLFRFSAAKYILPALLHLVMLMTWWTNIATASLRTFGDYLRRILSPTGFTMSAVPARIFEVPLWAQLRIFFVLHIEYVIIGALALPGVLILFRGFGRQQLNERSRSLYVHALIIIGIIATYLLFTIAYGLALIEYRRFIVYSIPFCILFVGLVLWRLNIFLRKAFSRTAVGKLVLASLLFVIFSISLIQFFPCQPLIPTASVLASDFPEDEYLVEIQLINTIYQKEMISFAETYSLKTRIASDVVTRWQIYAFSNSRLNSRHIYYSPLEPNQDRILEWDLFLLHTRKAGPFNEQVEYRTREIIENLRIEAGNLVYDNGESFIVSKAYNRAP